MTTASESCGTTSQMSLFGETCEPSTVQPFGLLPTPAVQEPGILPERIVDRHGNKPAHLNQRLYDKHTGRVVQDGLSQAVVLISSPQAIPASHSHSPGSDWARRMTATYGRKLGAYWLSSDPPDSWVRTLLGISTWGSTTCYLTWKKSVTPHGRLLFRLVPSTPRTAGIESGLWPTPNVAGGGNTCELTPHKGHYLRPSGEKAHLGLDQAARMWSTPRAEFDSGRHRGQPDTLHSAVKLWPTPKAGAGENRLMKRTPAVLNGTHGKHLAAEACEAERELGSYQAGMKLNSAWVSRMMGYPDGWLIPDGEVTQ
jgi:hypothetical protein